MRHLVDILTSLSAVLGMTTVGFAIAWMRARERAIRAESFMEGVRSVPAAHQRGTSPAIDAIAMEIERIGEGQRFLTKVIAEQRSAMLPSRAPGSITPH